MFTHICQSLLIFANLYSNLPMFTNICQCLLIFANVYLYLPMFTYICQSLLLFNEFFQSLLPFTDFYQCVSFDFKIAKDAGRLNASKFNLMTSSFTRSKKIRPFLTEICCHLISSPMHVRLLGKCRFKDCLGSGDFLFHQKECLLPSWGDSFEGH